MPDPRNARTYPKRQLEQIAASMRVFGFANPILVDGAGGIIAGHGCMLAAKMVGLAKVPSIILSHLIEAQQRALRLADNKIALGAGWDVEILKLELADLAVLDVDFDLSLTGFSAGEIDVVLQGQPDPDAELIPAVPVVADALEDVTRRGDLVLDTFLGSGATLIAAECTCRWFRGLDLDPGYVDVAVSRWSALTGLKPRLARCRGRWMDTVFIERLQRSMKYERVDLHAFETGSEMRVGLTRRIGYYNPDRPHSELAGQTPDEAYVANEMQSMVGLVPPAKTLQLAA